MNYMEWSKSICAADNKIKGMLVIFGLWALAFHDSIWSAINIWYISEIFTHGFFVIPAAIYILYKERNSWLGIDAQTNYWILVPIVLMFLLYFLGQAASLQLFKHVAVFSLLPLLLCFFLGTAVVKKIWFSLCFVLFCIPVGEELIPYLQDITADISVILLKLTNIPVFQSGLYIDIPEGRFVVAEACSGVRFFVGSIVFSAIYAYISYRALARQAAFMLVGIVVPVFANVLRVYGIILIGHYSNMEYATGADHIVYGWVFFAFVLFILVVVGERFRDKPALGEEELDTNLVSTNPALNKQHITSIATIAGLLLCCVLWSGMVVNKSNSADQSINRKVLKDLEIDETAGNGIVEYKNASDTYVGQFRKGGLANGFSDLVNINISWYNKNDEHSELISSANRLYSIERWSKVGSMTLNISDEDTAVSVLEISNSIGAKRLIIYWFDVNGKVLDKAYKAKLVQGLNGVIGHSQAGALLAIDIPGSFKDYSKARLSNLAESLQRLNSALPYNND